MSTIRWERKPENGGIRNVLHIDEENYPGQKVFACFVRGTMVTVLAGGGRSGDLMLVSMTNPYFSCEARYKAESCGNYHVPEAEALIEILQRGAKAAAQWAQYQNDLKIAPTAQ